MYFMSLKGFKLLSKIKANSINDCDFFLFYNFCRGAASVIIAPGARNVSSATTYSYSKCKQKSNDCLTFDNEKFTLFLKS